MGGIGMKQFKQFNLEEYIADPLLKVVMRNRRAVRIICTDKKGKYPVVAIAKNNKGEEEMFDCMADGTYIEGKISTRDLYFAYEKNKNMERKSIEDNIIRININEQCKKQHKMMLDKGFNGKNFGKDLMLIVSELSEALEADRKGKDTHKLPLPIEKSLLCRIGDSDFDKSTWKNYFESYVKDTIQDETADALLRIMDLCGRYDIDIDTHVALKSYYNSLRGHKHGKKY